MVDEEYVKKLESMIESMLTPLRNIPFPLVIEALSRHKVVPFNPSDDSDMKLLYKLEEAVKFAGEQMVTNGVHAGRVNEIGNAIEPFVRRGLENYNLHPQTPIGMNNRTQSTGYPDISINYNGEVHYIECKTYSEKTVHTTQRSFYLSPSDNFKVTKDGHHFLVSYEMKRVTPIGSSYLIFKPVHWMILSLEKLTVNVKYEFNSDNMSLYNNQNGLILREGNIPNLL